MQVEGYAKLIDEHAELFAELYGALLGQAVTFDLREAFGLLIGTDEPRVGLSRWHCMHDHVGKTYRDVTPINAISGVAAWFLPSPSLW